MHLTKFSTRIALAAVAIALLAGTSGCSPTENDSSQPTADRASQSEETINAEPDFAFDVNNLRAVAGQAQAIFIGTVVAKQGTKSLGALPESQFTVQVVRSLKGDRSGTLTVNQQGGQTKDGKIALLAGDPLLEPGKTYLLATRYLASENWYTVIPHAGHKEIPDSVNKLLQSPTLTTTSLLNSWTQAIRSALPPVGRTDALPPQGTGSPTTPGDPAPRPSTSQVQTTSSAEQAAPSATPTPAPGDGTTSPSS